MASKRKREYIIGYVHSIPPQKANKSFHLNIQTSPDVQKKAICFDHSKLAKLRDKKMLVVKLLNLRMCSLRNHKIIFLLK